MPASRANPSGRRGGILFEVVLAVALFGGAAAFTLAAVRSVFTTLDQTRRRQEAVDLARSKLAELEAGLINLADLRGGTGPTDAALPDEINSPSATPADPRPQWLFDLKTSRTEFTGLSLVELTVSEDLGPTADPSGGDGIRFTLRQLMPLRETDPEEYKPDELLEGIDE